MRMLTHSMTPAVCLLAALVATGCGDSAPSLTPTSVAGPNAAAGGATIAGRVNGGSGLALTTASTAGPLTVTVVGTNASSPVDSTGQFVLTGVPAGTIQLQFSGPGVSAMLTLTVSSQEQIQITVTVSGSTAVIQSQHRTGSSSRVELEGRITAIDLAARTLRVAGRLVNVPPTASIRRTSQTGSVTLQLSDLKVGDKVEVKGTSDGTAVQATEIRVELDNHGALQELEGVVSGRSGDCPNLTMTVRGTRVTTSGVTFFKEASCGRIQNNVTVEVKGHRQADGSLAAISVEIEDDEDDDEVEITGIVSGLAMACPTISFTVNGTRVLTNASTRFDGGCAAVQNGRRVEVEGRRQADGAVLATKVEIDD